MTHLRPGGPEGEGADGKPGDREHSPPLRGSRRRPQHHDVLLLAVIWVLAWTLLAALLPLH